MGVVNKLTCAPGTLDFMSPEELEIEPVYWKYSLTNQWVH